MTDAGREPLTLASAASAVGEARLSAAARIDPYWAGVWTPGSTARWLSRAGAERAAGMGLTRLPPQFAGSAEEAISQVTHGRNRAARLAALAAIGMWRTVTSQQLAALVGKTAMSGQTSQDLDVLWASGLVDRGWFPLGTPGDTTVSLYRPERSADFDVVSHRVGYADWVGMTGGDGLDWGGQFDRHNVLGTELALRAAEYTGVACVLGESMAGVGRLAAATGAQVSVPATRAADGLFVRADGMLIAVEMTATAGSNLPAKIAHWVSLLAADRAHKLTVLFVECAHPDFARRNGAAHRLLRKMLAKAAHSSMGAALADVPERMMLARWVDWFPGPGQLDRSFLGLDAVRPTGPASQRWEPVSALDPFAFDWDGGDEAVETATIERCRSLYGVPHWQRLPAGTDYSALLRHRAGVAAAPRLPYSRGYTSRR